MSDFERKKAASLAALRRTSIIERNYMPPTFALLWKWGVKIPPPHFMKAVPLTLMMGLPFGLCVLGLYMMDLGSKPFSPARASLLVLLVTLFVGGGFCFYYRTSARLHRLPQWADL